MGEVRKITVEILNTNQETETGKRIDELEKRFDKMLEPKKNSSTSKKEVSAKQYFAGKAFDLTLNLITQTASTSINKYFQLSEDYMSENVYKNTMVMVNKAKSLGGTVISGAIAGAKVGGVWGAIAGGTIAAIGWGGSEYIQNQAALSSYYQSINATSMQTEFSRTRAGLVDNGRGTDN